MDEEWRVEIEKRDIEWRTILRDRDNALKASMDSRDNNCMNSLGHCDRLKTWCVKMYAYVRKCTRRPK